MLKVKVFDEEHEEDLENSINSFIKKIHEGNIVSFHYAVSNFAAENREQIYSYSCLLVYKDKDK